MKESKLDDLSVFLEVARTRGFRSAAKQLNLSAGSVSQAIKRIEDQLGTRLIERTTRQVALTNQGELLSEKVTPLVTQLMDTLSEFDEQQDTVSGVLRLSAPNSTATLFLDDLLQKYSALYPEVGIEVLYEDQKVDMVTAGLDAVVRSQSLVERDTHAVKIGPRLTMALVASAGYLEKHNRPKSPSELIHHDGIRFAFGNSNQLAPWRFLKKKQSDYTVNPKPKVITNKLDSLIRHVEAGLGLAYIYRQPVQDLIDEGALISLFENQVPTLPRYTINYLTKRHMPLRLRKFIDLAKQQS